MHFGESLDEARTQFDLGPANRKHCWRRRGQSFIAPTVSWPVGASGTRLGCFEQLLFEFSLAERPVGADKLPGRIHFAPYVPEQHALQLAILLVIDDPF